MILLLETLHAEAEALLAAEGPVVLADAPDAPPADVSAVRAIVTRGRGDLSAELIARCPALEVVARAGAGLDNVDCIAAAGRGLPVIHAPGANAATVAEHSLALMLDLARGVTRTARDVSAGRWASRDGYAGRELAGLTLGVVGLGNVGRRVARLAAAFGMEVLAAEHPPGSGVRRGTAGEPDRYPLAALLALCDVITLHVPLHATTHELIGDLQLRLMRRGALLINTARGDLIDGRALRAALASGHLGGFAADVLSVEPPAPDDPLLSAPNVVLTPHVASLTGETYRAMCVATAENVARVLRGDTPAPESVFRLDDD